MSTIASYSHWIPQKPLLLPKQLLDFICHPPSVGVLFSGLASQSFQDSMRKSGSYTPSSHPYYLSCYHWHAIYFRTELCPNSRREDANKRFCRSISHPSSCVLSLLPPQRDSTITSRLRSAAIYPWRATRTKCFTSSVQYFLLNYQYTGLISFFYFFLCIWLWTLLYNFIVCIFHCIILCCVI